MKIHWKSRLHPPLLVIAIFMQMFHLSSGCQITGCTCQTFDFMGSQVACEWNHIPEDFDLNIPLNTSQLKISCPMRSAAKSKLKAGHFKRFNDLEELHLENCAVQDVSDRTFEGLPILRVLKLRKMKGLKLTARLFQPLISLDELRLIRISSENYLFFVQLLQSSTVRRLEFSEADFPLPNSVQTDYLIVAPRLEWLDLHETNVQDEHAYLFSNMSKLTHLNLNGNKFRSLNFLEKLPAPNILTVLAMQHNHLISVAPNSFEKCTSLSKLDLSHNHIARFDFSSMPNSLLTLTIDHNDIQELKRSKLTEIGHQKLNHFTMSYNSLAKLDANVLPKTLAKADFRDNNLAEIEPEAFEGMIWLHELVLSNNNLTGEFSEQLINCDKDNQRDLVNVWLSGNDFTDIIVKHCVNVVDQIDRVIVIPLQLNDASCSRPSNYNHSITQNCPPICECFGNSPDRILYESCSDFQNEFDLHSVAHTVTHLIVRNGRTTGTVLDLRLLHCLVLENNDLTVLDKKMFGTMRSLRHLSVAQNRLREFDVSKLFRSHPHLKSIDLSHNSMENIDELAFPMTNFSELTFVNVSYNNITEFPSNFIRDNSRANLALYGNPLVCDKPITDIDEKVLIKRVKDLSELTCLNGEGGSELLTDVRVEQSNRDISLHSLMVVAAVFLLLIILVFFCCLAVCYRKGVWPHQYYYQHIKMRAGSHEHIPMGNLSPTQSASGFPLALSVSPNRMKNIPSPPVITPPHRPYDRIAQACSDNEGTYDYVQGADFIRR